MGGFDQDEFNNFALERNVIGFEDPPIALKSKRKSYFYVNWRPVSEIVEGIYRLSKYVLNFADSKGLEPNCYYGVPAGATSLGLITQYRWAISHENFLERNFPLAMGRERPKDHGDPRDRHFIGKPEGETVVIEDVVTTGGSLIDKLNVLEEENVPIEAVIVLTDRNEKRSDGSSVSQAVWDMGLDYYAMSHALELLPIAYERQKPSKSIGRKIEEEFEQYGIKPLRIV